ncbi:hypothetical protein ES708_01877 [subsurface metagenome]
MNEVKYCPKCHKEAYRIEETEDMVKVIKGRRAVLNISRSSSVKMSLSCPSGHSVKLELKPVETEDGTREPSS